MARAFSPVLAVAIIMVSFQPLFSAEVLRYGTPVKGAPRFDMVVLAAEERGFWKENGLEVNWFPFRGSTEMVRAVAGGAVDAGGGDAVSLLLDVARGVPLLLVADLGVNQFFSIWVLNASPIKEPRDLKGAKIGISQFGGAGYATSLALVKSIGIEKEVRFVSVGGTAERVAAVKAGAIDAFVHIFVTVANLVVKGELREVASMRGRFPPDWPDTVLYARRDLVDKKPETVKRLIRAAFQSTNFIQQNPAWSVERLKSSLGFVEEAAKIVYEQLRFSRDGKISRKGVENIRDFLLEYQLLPRGKTLDMETAYTNRFVE